MNEIKDWEIKYLHAKAVRDSMLFMHGLPNNKNEKYGELYPVPSICLMKYVGSKFWESMEREGHNSTEFEKCKCRGISNENKAF